MLGEKESKECWECKEIKSLDDFYFNKTRGKYTNKCRLCYNRGMRLYRQELKILRPNYKKNKIRNSNLKRKFGITLDDYNLRVKIQEGKCLICNQERLSSKGKKLAIDHNHKTGKIRGLLCTRCNTLVGYIEFNIDLLPKVLHYLNSNP